MPSPHIQLGEDDLLYFLHIPKTAGTSFANLIRDHFPPDTVHQPLSQIEFLKTPPEVAGRTRFVAGHMVYNLSSIFAQEPIYITMLRDPVDRTISEYGQIKRSPEHGAYAIAKDQSLLEYVKDPRNITIYGNIQTRFIGFSEPTRIKGQWDDVDNPAHLERALERLEKFAFLGIAERYDESIEVLCDTFGWDLPKQTEIHNVGMNRPANIPQEAIDIIQEHTRQDRVLYDAAKRLFDARYQQMLVEHPERTREASAADSATVRNAILQQKVNALAGEVNGLNTKVSEMHAQIVGLSDQLEQINTSFGWRFILKVAAVRRTLIPEGSLVERTYLKIRNRLL